MENLTLEYCCGVSDNKHISIFKTSTIQTILSDIYCDDVAKIIVSFLDMRKLFVKNNIITRYSPIMPSLSCTTHLKPFNRNLYKSNSVKRGHYKKSKQLSKHRRSTCRMRRITLLYRCTERMIIDIITSVDIINRVIHGRFIYQDSNIIISAIKMNEWTIDNICLNEYF